jgi:hypothetical protein
MKISEGIEHFYNYQRLNVKKKLRCEIMNASWKISGTISAT